jgi:hypothetical protein
MLPADLPGDCRALLNDAKERVALANLWANLGTVPCRSS